MAGVPDGEAAGAAVSVEDRGASAGVPVAGLAGQGFKVWGKVARPADSGVFGKNKGPFWPHAPNIAAPPTRACVVTRIFMIFNMLRL
jgi:hypothetical protein